MGSETALQRYVLNGGVMMVFLVPLAVLMVAFAVQGFINLRRGRVCPRAYTRRLAERFQAPVSHREAEELLEREPHSIGLILRRVLSHLEFAPDADPAELLREGIEEECAALQQRNSQLAVVYNIAPLMGLLGTVFGMIRTFREFTTSADPSIRELSTGINLALLTTAWGLSIAIPAFLFLYIFARRINTYEQVLLPREGSDALHIVLRAIGFERVSRSSPGMKPVEGE